MPDPARLNAWTVGLAAGRIEGAPLRFAAELARVLDDGDNMRVLPIVTRGIFDNVFDLLYLRGVDAAIVHGDVLEHFKKDQKISGIERRINYLMPLFPSEVHVFVRPEITKLEELAGKVVNFNTQGTAAAYSGPIIFERLGINIEPRFVPHPVALGEMAKNDKYAAAVFVSTKPLDPFVKRKWPEGFKFLPVPLTQALEEYYLPAQLEAADYPGLIPEGQKVHTVAVPMVLAVYNWRNDAERQQRLARLVDYLFERFTKLQTEPGYHPQWSEVNLAAIVPGWQRFRADAGEAQCCTPEGSQECRRWRSGPNSARRWRRTGSRGDACARAGARRAAQAVGGSWGGHMSKLLPREPGRTIWQRHRPRARQELHRTVRGCHRGRRHVRWGHGHRHQSLRTRDGADRGRPGAGYRVRGDLVYLRVGGPAEAVPPRNRPLLVSCLETRWSKQTAAKVPGSGQRDQTPILGDPNVCDGKEIGSLQQHWSSRLSDKLRGGPPVCSLRS